jgi:3-oxoacyl-[acyl-carrier protein] reductase
MSESPTRVAIVTGGARGIGAVTAERLARDHMAVVVRDLEQPACQSAVDQIAASGGQALALGCDVADAEQGQSVVNRVAGDLGPPTVLVNNAGVIRDNLLHKMTDDDWDTRHRRAPARRVPDEPGGPSAHDRAALGRIVNLSSVSALATAARPTTPRPRRGCRG